MMVTLQVIRMSLKQRIPPSSNPSLQIFRSSIMSHPLSFAAVLHGGPRDGKTPSTPNQRSEFKPGFSPSSASAPGIQANEPSQVAMLSGHYDITPAQFSAHYEPLLRHATSSGHHFIVSNSRGADTMCLGYLKSGFVDPSRITIYLHQPYQKSADDERRFKELGYNVRTVKGGHTQRDQVMTAESDYDILWVRSEEETKMLYGKKYRAGRVSGTEKNRLRRLEKS